jgi:hypothetical protein
MRQGQGILFGDAESKGRPMEMLQPMRRAWQQPHPVPQELLVWHVFEKML